LAISKEQRVSLMEIRINLYAAAIGIALAATVTFIALDIAGLIPAMHGLVVGNGLLIVAATLFVTSRLERYAAQAYRRGHEVGKDDAVRSIGSLR
jgi:hypothetical protein